MVVLQHVLGFNFLDRNGGGHGARIGDGDVDVVDSLGLDGLDGGSGVGGGGGFDVHEKKLGAGSGGKGLELGDGWCEQVANGADDGVVGTGEVELGDAGADA